MKNKGFTLIEIIAVIVIMGILLVVVFAGTSRLMKSNDEKKYTTYYDIVKEGLEKYARTRRNEVDGDGTLLPTGCTSYTNRYEIQASKYVAIDPAGNITTCSFVR